jgi:hypothetical protein
VKKYAGVTRKKFEMVIETDTGDRMEWKTDPGGSFILDNLFDSYFDFILQAKYDNPAAKAAVTDQVSFIYYAILEKSEDHVKRKRNNETPCSSSWISINKGTFCDSNHKILMVYQIHDGMYHMCKDMITKIFHQSYVN